MKKNRSAGSWLRACSCVSVVWVLTLAGCSNNGEGQPGSAAAGPGGPQGPMPVPVVRVEPETLQLTWGIPPPRFPVSGKWKFAHASAAL
ncbi:MAG: hypothetical protein HC848_06840 [Limnobacter sp.]|nr:hypothetical protein [Limnobacter sp.]